MFIKQSDVFCWHATPQEDLGIEDEEKLKHEYKRLHQAMEMVGFLVSTKKLYEWLYLFKINFCWPFVKVLGGMFLTSSCIPMKALKISL